MPKHRRCVKITRQSLPPERLSAGKLERLFLFKPLPLRRGTVFPLPIPLEIVRVLHRLDIPIIHHAQLDAPGFPRKLFLTQLGLALFHEVLDVQVIPHLDEGLQLVEQVIKHLLLLIGERALIAAAKQVQVGHAYYLYLI